MKKIITSFIAFLVVFSVSASPALAIIHPESAPPVRGVDEPAGPAGVERGPVPVKDLRTRAIEKGQDVREKVGDVRRQIREKRQEIRQRLAERKKIRIKAFFNRMAKRMDFAVIRLNKLADRIESRLNKFEQMGKDIGDSRVLLEEARTAILSAKTAIEEAKSKIDEVLESDEPRTAFGQIRSLVHEVRDSIKAAHQALVNVIRNLKPRAMPEKEQVSEQESEENDATEETNQE
jgi:hypothetical protein